MKRLAALALVCCGGEGGTSHWASDARTSAGLVDAARGALQATGSPDAVVCGDSPLAWEAPPGTLSWLELDYPQEVVARAVRVHQTLGPGQVTRVEVRATSGDWKTVLERLAAIEPFCPSVLEATIDPTEKVRQVRVWVDTQASFEESQIDAVAVVSAPAAP